MNQNALLAEQIQICQGFLPIDMSSGANDGDWVNMAKYEVCSLVLFKDAGTAAQDPTLTLEQATDVSGTGAKAVTFTRIDSKQAATNLLAVGQYTATNQTAAATYTEGTLGEQTAIVVVDIRAEMLDVANDFNCIRGRVADTGATSGAFGALLYLLWGARHQGVLPSAIV